MVRLPTNLTIPSSEPCVAVLASGSLLSTYPLLAAAGAELHSRGRGSPTENRSPGEIETA